MPSVKVTNGHNSVVVSSPEDLPSGIAWYNAAIGAFEEALKSATGEVRHAIESLQDKIARRFWRAHDDALWE